MAMRAKWHRWRTGHRIWSDVMVWPGEMETVWFCECGEQFWPLHKEGPDKDWRDSDVRREPPWERGVQASGWSGQGSSL